MQITHIIFLLFLGPKNNDNSQNHTKGKGKTLRNFLSRSREGSFSNENSESESNELGWI